MYSCIRSGLVHGVEGKMINVEADVSDGLPVFSLVGLLSSEVKEAGERVRNALKNSGFPMQPKHVTVNLSPADIKKAGSGFDLAIAAAVLCAYGYMPAEECGEFLFLGELGLDGMVKPVTGVLPIVDAARKQGITRCIVPCANLGEARLVEKVTVMGAESLKAVTAFFMQGEPLCSEYGVPAGGEEESLLDFADIKGQMALKRAVTIAAAGMHNVLIGGPPGAGKSMIAKRLPTILPDLTYSESMELTKVYSVAGLLTRSGGLIKKRPFRAPHHTVSEKALIGGGTTPKPGEVSLAHCGVLFLDEFPEFKRHVMEALRQPLEDRIATVSRVNGTYTFPAGFFLAAAMNMCPCGYYPDTNRCRCTEYARRGYLNKISRPILDRMDIQLLIEPTRYEDLLSDTSEEPDSAQIRRTVERAHAVQHKRYRNENILFNTQLDGKLLHRFCRLDAESREILRSAHERMGLSARAHVRVLRVARTIADLEDADWIRREHLLEALSYREMEGLKG